MLWNGHRLRREPHTESLCGIRLNIKDFGNAALKVLVLCQALHHCDDGLVHWGHVPALPGMAGPSRGGGGDLRWPSLILIFV